MATHRGKGSKFERDISRILSEWWSGGERDDIFWRVKGSGGRAKRRGRSGKATFGQHGDIAATDPIGTPLLQVFTIELKHGYSARTMMDLLDRPEGIHKTSAQQYDKWLTQVKESAAQAGTPYWLLITKRNGREPLVFYPLSLNSDHTGLFVPMPCIQLFVKNPAGKIMQTVVGTTLKTWLQTTMPRIINQLAKEK